MTAETVTETPSTQERQTLAQSSLWHLLFFAPLVAHSHAIPVILEAFAQNSATAAVVYSASVLEALAYTKAGAGVHDLLQSLSLENNVVDAAHEDEQPHSWMGILCAHVRDHAGQLLSPRPDSTTLLTAVLQETQQRYEAGEALTKTTHASSPCDALFAALAADYLAHTTAGHQESPRSGQHSTLFQLAPLSSSSPSSSGSAVERNTAARQQRQWYEARLYGALACAACLTRPGPLARLLVAYAHANDGRLQAVVDDNLAAHLRAVVQEKKEPEGSTSRAAASATSSSSAEAAASYARARLSGLVAGVLEYTLCVAHSRSAVTAAALNDTARAPFSSDSIAGLSSVSQNTALLLVQLTEECGYYEETASSTGERGSSAAAVTTAVVHDMQELLFTIVLGGGTHGMANRPEPVVPKKPITSVTAAGAVAVPLVATVRGVSLPEADAVTQELFPCLVQQLGVEWLWSPLLRHLSSLDKQQPQPLSVSENDGVPPLPHAAVRWSSHLLMDTVLLAAARKTYPQRLLNILPGSYERLLQNLDLLPPMRPPGDDSAEEDAAAGRGAGAVLFDMPAYYAEPANALVAYFRRAGTSGLRLEEVDRLLSTVTGSYEMLVRLKAQAPPRTDADESTDEMGTEVDDDKDEGNNTENSTAEGEKLVHHGSRATATSAHSYALSRERVKHLISRYLGEVLLASVVVYTQLRVPSQVQQLMRALAPLFLNIHLAWRTFHDGSVASWLLQQQRSNSSNGGTRSVRFSNEAAVLLDKVGYEFYPLEWLPAVAASVCAAPTSAADGFSSPRLPYSLFAAVGHQFRLQLRGTPLGGSGDATLRHPAGPRTAAVMPTADFPSLFSSREGSASEDTAAAWRRAERFFTGLLQACYLDPKTSSTELEGTLAVSSMRRVLTTNDGLAQAGYGGAGGDGTSLVSAAAIAAQRLRSLLQQPTVKDAMWGSMAADATAGARRLPPPHGQKRSRSALTPEAEREEATTHLRAMRQLLLDYGAASFDTTVEAADVALTVAQSFLPSAAGVSSAFSTTTSASREKSSDILLHRALEWSRGVVGSSTTRAKVNMLLQQQRQQRRQPQHESGASTTATTASLPSWLAGAYNSATVDAAWLARSALRSVPRRIWEKIEVQQAQVRALAQREAKWVSRLPGSPVAGAAAAAGGKEEKTDATHFRVDPLLLEQWTQWTRVWQQLGLADGLSSNDSFAAPPSVSAVPQAAEEISCAQWLWYSPYFAAEWSSH